MNYKSKGHAQNAHGPNPATPIVRAYAQTLHCHDPQLFDLYARAARSTYSEYEPRPLTKARQDLDSWRRALITLNAADLPGLVPTHVLYALRIGGWVL